MEMQVTGVMLYYYFVCKRKCWLFTHGVEAEEGNDLVTLGRIIDEGTFQREDKHIEIESVINIDFIRSKKELHEVKKSKAIEHASIMQVVYYLWFLEKRGVKGLHGVINYPLLKQSVDVELTDERRKEIEEALQEIQNLINDDTVPAVMNSKICKKCAYHDICYIAE